MAILLFFYKLLLEKENMHVFKRFYLLGALAFSFIVPSIVFVEYVEPITAALTVQPMDGTATVVEAPLPNDMDTINWSLVGWSLYSIGLLGFVFRFFRNLFQILNRIRNNPKIEQRFTINVLLREKFIPHTFFNYVFLNKPDFESKIIPSEVLLHEEVHAKQKHSIDVLLIEIVHMLFWFNPLLYFFKKAIKLNHEFLADSAVLKKESSTREYQNTLLSYLSNDSLHKYQSVKMANAINYSSIKKRFKIMKTHTSKKSILIRILLIIPLTTLLLYSFSDKAIIEKQPTNVETELTKNDIGEKRFVLNIRQSQIVLNGKKIELDAFAKKVDKLTKDWEEPDYTAIKVQASYSDTPSSFLKKVSKEFKKTHLSKANEKVNIFPDDDKKATIQKGASREQMREYNALAKKYNEMSKNYFHIKGEEVDRLTYLYNLMSDKQRNDAEPFPDFPEPPPVPKAPGAEEALNQQAAQLQKQEALMEQLEAKMHEREKIMKEHEKQMRLNEAEMKKLESKMKKQEAVMLQEVSSIPQPPAPPEPKNPLQLALELAKEDAIFYHKGKKVTADQAIEILKKDGDLSMSITRTNDETPVVKIDTHF